MKKRIEYLDGHRGLAILLVILYHAYARWPELVPYGGSYAKFPLFKYGGLGVELFFILSGFVILMTLEKCSTAKEFLYRRWLRLFPAMLVCSLLVFSTSNFFFERPAGSPQWVSLLPGLTFIEPSWWSVLVGRAVYGLEGAFWSLYVEFKFYVFAAVLYYWRGRNALFYGLLLAFLTAVASKIAGDFLGLYKSSFVDHLLSNLSFSYFGWFFSGAAFYIFAQNRSQKWFAAACVAAILSAVFDGNFDLHKALVGVILSMFFAASISIERIQNFLSSKPMQFFGLISYPLYLIHENMMVSIIVKLGNGAKSLPPLLLPIPAVIFLSLLAFLVSKYLEPLVKTFLVKALARKKSIESITP